MKIRHADVPKKCWHVLADAMSSFSRNNDLTAASSLAFSAALALIPALFLLTFLLGAAVGSSARAFQKMQELMSQLFPAYSGIVLREVNFITGHKGTIGFVNLVVLFWAITPLVADLRVWLGAIFRRKRSRPFLLEKLFDAMVSGVFLVGLTAVSVAGAALTFLERRRAIRLVPGYVEEIAVFFVVTGVVLAVYSIFSVRARFRHLLAGALATSVLWFTVRPAFHLFLAYNPGYGYAFGSFKSLFIIVIWIYLSLVLFLFGAEIAASLSRDETVIIRNLIEGRKNIPAAAASRHVLRYQKESVIFREGDPGNEMYTVLKGRISIRKDGKEIGVIRQGKSFGGLSFLLSSPRAATAVAVEDVELIPLTNENINNLMNEFPELVVDMLRDMAVRLRETSGMAD